MQSIKTVKPCYRVQSFPNVHILCKIPLLQLSGHLQEPLILRSH